MQLTQTAPIALLPPEIVSLIVNLVAVDGAKTPEFKAPVKTCRAGYLAGLPWLYREINRWGSDAALKLKGIACGYTGIDKTSFMRDLYIGSGVRWNKGSLGVLAKCLASVNRLFLSAGNKNVLQTIWDLVLSDATVLEELELRVYGDAMEFFKETTVFPASVRVFHTDALEHGFKSPLKDMIDQRAPNLRDLRILYKHTGLVEDLDLPSYPGLASKLLRLNIYATDALLLPLSIVHLTMENHGVRFDEAMVNHLDKMEGLEYLAINKFRTSDLVNMVGRLKSLKTLRFGCPVFTLEPDNIERVISAVTRPGLEFEIRSYGWDCLDDDQAVVEWRFWSTLPGIVAK